MAPRKKAVIAVAHEEARISAQRVVSGRVSIETTVETTNETVTAFLDSDCVEIERVRLDKAVAIAPVVRTEGDTTIVPVVEEILVVEKRLILREEIRITRRSEEKSVEVPVALRRQKSVIRRQSADGATVVEE